MPIHIANPSVASTWSIMNSPIDMATKRTNWNISSRTRELLPSHRSCLSLDLTANVINALFYACKARSRLNCGVFGKSLIFGHHQTPHPRSFDLLKRVKRFQLSEAWDGPECTEWMFLLPWRRDNRAPLSFSQIYSERQNSSSSAIHDHLGISA